MYEYIKSEVEKAVPAAINKRHIIHRNPELSFHEFNTSSLVCETLSELGIEFQSGLAGTGVLGIINGLKHEDNSKTVLIRADMDALPVNEDSGLPFSSEKENVMHACGHDIHTSILLCCAQVLNNLKDKFSGCVKLMFQPGEETSGGAKPMIDSGILENPKVNSCVALHIEPSLNVGQVRFKPGAAYACPDEFSIKILGKGGHAADPHKCIDPILISSEIVCALQTIPSRIINPLNPVVVSVCSINGGSTYNVIPDFVHIKGTARSFSDYDRDLLEKKIGLTVKQICELYGAEFEYKFDRLFPPLINDKNTIERLKNSAEKYLKPEDIFFGGEPTMGGEDFSYLTRAVNDSALFWLGCTEEKAAQYPLHNCRLAASDSCIKYGAEILVDYVTQYLNEN